MRWRRVAPVSMILLTGCSSCEDPSFTPPPQPLEGVALVRAFPSLTFNRPLYITAPPGVTDRLFVVEQDGKIFTFDPNEAEPERKLFLDLSTKVIRIGNEEGLLGLAFHPDYANNGRFFVDYSAPGPRSVISELTVSSDRDRADAGSERIVLTQDQPYRNHNGGMIAFGPDGYLYIGFGDGGAGGDPENHAQDLASWLGKILRIDVDTSSETQPFSVPSDNPFAQGGGAGEVWAFGLRNPWRFSFDRATGALWAGDVGQDRFEEVDIITPGSNYGWRPFEGNEQFEDEDLSHGDHVPPIVAYAHNEGKSVTGGYVYRGASLPLLQGVYVFGDFDSGVIWGLRPAAGGYERRLLLESGHNIASFGEDASGELYACAFDGAIYRLVADDEEPDDLPPLPGLLSELDLFDDVAAQVPAGDLVPYRVNAPLWSDGAAKERFARVPAGQAITFSPADRWSFPDGTTLVKTFSLPIGGISRRLETRVIRKQGGYFQAASYVWDDAQSDAALAFDGARIDLGDGAPLATWVVPSHTDCRSCHTDAVGFVLGLETAQINRDGQLRDWAERGILSGVPDDADALPALASPDDDGADLEARARAYLHANCAQCHLPNGPGNATIDLRWSTPLGQMNALGAAPGQGDLGVDGALIIAPGDPDRSLISLRMTTRGLGAMPPLATQLVDEAGVELVQSWIESLE